MYKYTDCCQGAVVARIFPVEVEIEILVLTRNHQSSDMIWAVLDKQHCGHTTKFGSIISFSQNATCREDFRGYTTRPEIKAAR